MATSAQTSFSWLAAARTPEVVRRSLKVSLLVGSILAVINHGDQLIGGTAAVDVFWKILLTYCVPYAVSTFASVDALRSRRQKSI